PLDGMDVWPTLSEGKPSLRTEVIYNVEPFAAGVRTGEWKLVWRATLPSQIELFNLREDPSEQANIADKNPAKVAELQKRAEGLAGEGLPPLLMKDAMGVLWKAMTGSVSLPEDDKELDMEP